MSPTDTDPQAFNEIKTAIDGRSAAEINAYVAGREGGVDGLLDLVFANLPGAFLPERAAGLGITFQYVLQTPEGERRYHAVVRDGVCTTGKGDIASPTTTMSMDLSVFLQVLVGTLAPVRAFLTRKIKVSGDMMAATKFESWFARP